MSICLTLTQPLSLLFLSGMGDKIGGRSWWVKIRTGDHSLVTITGKIDSTWEKLVKIDLNGEKQRQNQNNTLGLLVCTSTYTCPTAVSPQVLGKTQESRSGLRVEMLG